MLRSAVGWLVLGATGALVASCSFMTSTEGLAGPPKDAAVDVETGPGPAPEPADGSPDVVLPSDAACASGLLTCGGKGACATNGGENPNCGACGLVCDRCLGGACHVCLTAIENETLTLSCPAGTVVRDIVFASYGTPDGSCGSFARAGACDASTSITVVADRCLGARACSLGADNATFSDPCTTIEKRLFVEVRCAP